MLFEFGKEQGGYYDVEYIETIGEQKHLGARSIVVMRALRQDS